MASTPDWIPTVPTTPEVDEKVQPDFAEEEEAIDHAAERALVGQPRCEIIDIRYGDLT
jgi:hypothetical protein